MLSILTQPQRAPHAFTRRELLRIGGASLLGLNVAELARLRAGAAEQAASSAGESFGRQNSCVFIFLFGGPSHIDLWDMKPAAPVEVRGDFRPIATTVPGVQVCEHLPLLAQQMERVCLVRSMHHQMPVHGPACSEMYTGREYPLAPVTDEARPEDWPSLAALATRFGPRPHGLPPAAVVPWHTQFDGQSRRIAGQTAGRMGEQFDPFLMAADLRSAVFDTRRLYLPDGFPTTRLDDRRRLLGELGAAARSLGEGRSVEIFRQHQETAYGMLADGRIARAIDLAREPEPTHERYGPTIFGRSLLAARRLVEAGVPLVTVNWYDESVTEKVSPLWDQHNHIFPTLKDRMLPVFDRALTAFLADLAERELLETTLVAATGEFGRTPKIGQFTQNNMTEKTGRDHWPHAFTVLLAGGGVRGGQVYGATDRLGGHVKDNPTTPSDLAATMLKHLGIDPRQRYWDHFQQREQPLCEGTPIPVSG
jgi:Protein of unknown function (DUF1501)